MQRVILVKRGNGIGIRVSTPQDDVRVARYLLRVAKYLSRVAVCFCQILQRVILDGKLEKAFGIRVFTPQDDVRVASTCSGLPGKKICQRE